MTTALEICQNAYNEANPGQDLTSFSQQDWPYSLALGFLNKVISELNIYSYWFMETETLLPFSAGSNTYNLLMLGINPKSIVKVETRSNDGSAVSVSNVWPMNYYRLSLKWPSTALSDSQPGFFARYANTLYLNDLPQVDYQVVVMHSAKIPQMVDENSQLGVPIEYEHVFQDGVLIHLLMALSRSDALQKYQIWQNKIKDMAAEIEMDYAMATQLPAGF